MGWYRTGTISGTSGSNVVTGSNTNFIDTAAGVNAGDALIVGGVFYEVAGVTNATQLVLATNISASFSGTAYQIITSTSMSNQSLAKKTAAALDRILTSIANWMTILTGTGTVSITPYGSSQSYSGLAWPEIANQLASKASRSSNLADLTNISGARDNLGVGYGSTAGTVTQGNDPRLATVNGKSGGNITSAVTISGSLNAGAITGTGPITGPATGGLAVGAGESNRVELNNVGSGGNTGSPVGWTVYRWYGELVQTGIRRAGDTTIQSYFMAMSSVGSWEFLRSGNASAPGSWVNGSDIRHKTKISVVENALSAILSLRGVTYDKKDGGREVGIIAQETEKFCPDAVTTTGDRKFMDGTVIPDFKYLNTAGVSAAYHTEAIKSLFDLMTLVLNDPEKAKGMIEEIKTKAEEISKIEVVSKPAWKEDAPVFDVPSNETSEVQLDESTETTEAPATNVESE